MRTDHAVEDEGEDSAVEHGDKGIYSHDGYIIHSRPVQRPRRIHHKEMAVGHKHRPAQQVAINFCSAEVSASPAHRSTFQGLNFTQRDGRQESEFGTWSKGKRRTCR